MIGELVEQGDHPVQRGDARGVVAVGVGPDMEEGVDQQGVGCCLIALQLQRQWVEPRGGAAVQRGEGARIPVAALGEQVAEEVGFVRVDGGLRRCRGERRGWRLRIDAAFLQGRACSCKSVGRITRNR